jgi:hypothetical protein
MIDENGLLLNKAETASKSDNSKVSCGRICDQGSVVVNGRLYEVRDSQNRSSFGDAGRPARYLGARTP